MNYLYALAASAGGGSNSGGFGDESAPVGIELLLNIIIKIYNSIYDFFTNPELWNFLTDVYIEFEYYSFIKKDVITGNFNLLSIMFGGGITVFLMIVLFKWIKEIVID